VEAGIFLCVRMRRRSVGTFLCASGDFSLRADAEAERRVFSLRKQRYFFAEAELRINFAEAEYGGRIAAVNFLLSAQS